MVIENAMIHRGLAFEDYFGTLGLCSPKTVCKLDRNLDQHYVYVYMKLHELAFYIIPYYIMMLIYVNDHPAYNVNATSWLIINK